MRQRQINECYLCGTALDGPVSRDHVVPEGLFPEGNKPPNLLTFRVHDACNRSLSEDEDVFRVFVLGQSYGQSDATTVWNGPVRRSLSRRPGQNGFKAGLANCISPLPVPAPFFDEDGTYQGNGSLMTVPQARINRVIEKIVKGLYYFHNGRLLTGVAFAIRHFDPYPGFKYAPEAFEPEPWSKANRGRDFGGVFRYFYAVAHEDPLYSRWWLQFYEKPLFIVATEPAALPCGNGANVGPLARIDSGETI